MHCPDCGNPNLDTSDFCGECGASLKEAREAMQAGPSAQGAIGSSPSIVQQPAEGNASNTAPSSSMSVPPPSSRNATGGCPNCHSANVDLEYHTERSEVTKKEGCGSKTWGCVSFIVLAALGGLISHVVAGVILVVGTLYVLFSAGDEKTNYVDKHYRCRQCGNKWKETDTV